jgi:hypothetical protein
VRYTKKRYNAIVKIIEAVVEEYASSKKNRLYFSWRRGSFYFVLSHYLK